MSTESTITIEEDGRYINLPTVIGGQRYSEDDAISLFHQGRNPAVGIYSSEERADRQAEMRHRAFARGLGL